MPKAISAGLQAHLEQEVTTLATCWEITRLDGEVFRFTDHDRDLEIDGETYSSSVGYQRTAIANDSSLGIDNLDLLGFFDDTLLKLSDLRSGKFDFAEVSLFVVNWDDLSQGILRLRRGYLGEVESTSSGMFKVELRGMMQRLAQRVGEIFTPECRADLGDSRCKVPIAPSAVARATAYAVGDYVTEADFVPPADPSALALVNPGAESGTTGWIDQLGSLAVSSTSPHGGSNKFTGGDNAETKAYQEIAIPADEYAAVDAGDRQALLTWWQDSSLSDADTAGMGLEFYAAPPPPANLTFVTSITASTVTIDFSTAPTIQAGDLAVFCNFASQLTDSAPATVVPTDFDVARNHTSSFARHIISYKVLEAGDLAATFTGMDPVGGSSQQQRITVLFFRPDEPIVGVTPTGTSTISGTGNPSPISLTLSGKPTPAVVVAAYGEHNSTFSPRTATPAFDAEVTNNNWYVKYSTFDDGETIPDFTVDMDDEGTFSNTMLVCLEVTSEAPLDTEADVQSNTDGWALRALTATVPATTRRIRAYMRMVRASGTPNDGYIDDIGLSLMGDPSSEDVIFRCTTAGTTDASPVDLDGTVGLTTADGTVVWTAEEAWTRIATVLYSDDDSGMVLALSDPDARAAVDDWFALGGLKWLTGEAAGLGGEIRSWDASTITLQMYEPMPALVIPGDVVSLYPGCDKRRVTCRDRFNNVVNMRAEPDTPGQDALVRVADGSEESA